MAGDGSVTHWLEQLKGGDRKALQPLWERYFQRLVGLARSRLQGAPRAAADEEDAVLSAFDSFYHAIERKRFPRLDDRDDLWQVLVLLTVRKTANLRKHARRPRRGGGRVLPATDRAAGGAADDPMDLLAGVVHREPSPDFAVQVAEECERLLARLDDPQLRSIALWKMEGYTNEEIAGRLGCVTRTVERRLGVIRGLWSQETER
jgi:DNA-directed RNA polymerase specialized sigma24 family protein